MVLQTAGLPAWSGAPTGGRQSWRRDHVGGDVIRVDAWWWKARKDAGLGLPGLAPLGSVGRREGGVGRDEGILGLPEVNLGQGCVV